MKKSLCFDLSVGAVEHESLVGHIIGVTIHSPWERSLCIHHELDAHGHNPHLLKLLQLFLIHDPFKVFLLRFGFYHDQVLTLSASSNENISIYELSLNRGWGNSLHRCDSC